MYTNTDICSPVNLLVVLFEQLCWPQNGITNIDVLNPFQVATPHVRNNTFVCHMKSYWPCISGMRSKDVWRQVERTYFTSISLSGLLEF